ncbi:hypothetical protein T484DRAFT_3527150 [Baffinella frigidus]|nr:hypothetical protein T484DRAFT_3527150 [Cryptophyta sp. CCMP2293]
MDGRAGRARDRSREARDRSREPPPKQRHSRSPRRHAGPLAPIDLPSARRNPDDRSAAGAGPRKPRGPPPVPAYNDFVARPPRTRQEEDDVAEGELTAADMVARSQKEIERIKMRTRDMARFKGQQQMLHRGANKQSPRGKEGQPNSGLRRDFE